MECVKTCAYDNAALFWRNAGWDKRDEAIACFQKSVQLNPMNATAHFNLGLTLLQQGNQSPGVKEVSEAIRLKPNYATAHFRLGFAFLVSRRIDEAIARFREGLRYRPDNTEGHLGLGSATASSMARAKSWACRSIQAGVGRGEWIRTTDLLVPNSEVLCPQASTFVFFQQHTGHMIFKSDAESTGIRSRGCTLGCTAWFRKSDLTRERGCLIRRSRVQGRDAGDSGLLRASRISLSSFAHTPARRHVAVARSVDRASETGVTWYAWRRDTHRTDASTDANAAVIEDRRSLPNWQLL